MFFFVVVFLFALQDAPDPVKGPLTVLLDYFSTIQSDDLSGSFHQIYRLNNLLNSWQHTAHCGFEDLDVIKEKRVSCNVFTIPRWRFNLSASAPERSINNTKMQIVFIYFPITFSNRSYTTWCAHKMHTILILLSIDSHF